ncbi:hypothetical protein KVT40_003756 [Elsinoe batatas]|uniref:Alpha-galactosidase A n=1 Tax=Elsinoe batatas TaxID=2601811 RepID=A0A8K0PHX1_9PEZI|nr:hypothetical protein KVT40_003756 [Elsinoe batatas]
MSPSAVKILQCSADEADDSEFRVLVDGKYVKYITIEHGVFDVRDMCFFPVLEQLLPPFPTGDWNEGRITLDGGVKATFSELSKSELPSVSNIWHQGQIDYLDLTLGKMYNSNVREAALPEASASFIAKFACFPWQNHWIENETEAYSWIEGHNLGPKFLGHITEHGRVMGLMVEKIEGTRHAGLKDLAACRQVLARLHALGIKKGDINRHNFLVRKGQAFMIDFDGAEKCDDPEVLEAEMEALEAELQDVSGRGGRIHVDADGKETVVSLQ